MEVTGMMYPIYINEEGVALPESGTYYVIAGNGTFLHKDTGIVRCLMPVNSISSLADVNEELQIQCSLPKVPAKLVWKIKEFFRAVVDLYSSEAEINLYFNKATGDYKIHVPEQSVSYGSVDYRRVGLTHVEGMEDYLRVGTIHSHANFSAFHSGTDVSDETDFDGLHVTFGHNDVDIFSISATVVANSKRAKVSPEKFLEGIDAVFAPRGGSADVDYWQLAPEYRDIRCSELDEWIAKVEKFGDVFWKHNNRIKAGDEIVWAGEHTATQLKTTIGEGPFKVLAVEKSKVVIRTNVGLAKFSNKLFDKVNS